MMRSDIPSGDNSTGVGTDSERNTIADRPQLAEERYNMSQTNTGDDNILNRICGPAMPLPTDKEYYVFPSDRPHKSTIADYTCTFGALANGHTGRVGPGHLDVQHAVKGPKEEYLYNYQAGAINSYDLAAEQNNGGTVLNQSWMKARDYTYGIDFSAQYAFGEGGEADDAGMGDLGQKWPLPNEMYVMSQDIDTRRLG
ncbi:hypothetical protein CVT24_007853 [Panaeolus cyanescens]|uniref:Uncharacterized protein n=1 Tax=Panaeolus cyanescens TaxID=181874 RepID=A0A409VZD0_9AGAR|nr:hypothetical protein CVT24_007853 [Panaeolus cyanescens]